MLGITYISTYQSLKEDFISRGLRDSFGFTFIFKHTSVPESLRAIVNQSVYSLPRRGVCLAKSKGNPKLIRVYTTNVTDKEMEQITESASGV